MRNFIAIVFHSAPEAFKGLFELEHLDAQGAITLHEAFVIERLPDGTIAPKYSHTNQPPLRHPGIGALLGALAGLAAGPVGVVIGGAVGVLGGTLDDAIRAGASDEYIERIGEHMTPGTYALIADVHETENDPINS